MAAGAVFGSGAGALHNISIKVQESNDPAGTGTAWTDITNGAIHAGSWDFDQLSISGTNPQMYMEKQYEYICGKDANRKRYIRAHASLAGTVGLGAKLFVGFLLGRPQSSLYVADAEIQATGNAEFAILK